MSIIKQSHCFSKRFFAVEYPGVVNNVDKMLETLGGIENISNCFTSKNHRLELRFRPDDIYCKSTCADKHNASAFLLKVRVKRRKKDLNEPGSSTENTETTPEVTAVNIIGYVDTVFKFTNLCDFQYLPVRSSNDEIATICNNVVPRSIPDISWLEEECEFFFPPATFSRMDTNQGYMYKKDSSRDPYAQQQIIGRTRRRRAGHAAFISFADPTPEKPHKKSIEMLQLKLITQIQQRRIKELFEERPIYSRSALLHLTQFTVDQMKHLLPSVAYYFTNGPWRVMWVRFGYDPRKDPSSRIYQTLDFRVRASGHLTHLIKAKRGTSQYSLPYKKSYATSKPKTTTLSRKINLEPSRQAASHSENTYIFRPGMIPYSRQTFYQYCDIEVPEVQAMVARLPEVESGAVCNEKLGWMPVGFDDRCRQIINSHIMVELQKKRQQSVKQENDGNIEANEDDANEFEDDDDNEYEDDDDDDDVNDVGENA